MQLLPPRDVPTRSSSNVTREVTIDSNIRSCAAQSTCLYYLRVRHVRTGTFRDSEVVELYV